MTWPLQSDTLPAEGGGKTFGRVLFGGLRSDTQNARERDGGGKRIRFLPVLLLLALLILLAAPAYPSVCSTPCDSKCPTANGTPVCEPINFAADAYLQKGVLTYGESTWADVVVRSSEQNVTISCTYTFDGTNRTAPVSIPNDGAEHPIGNETVTAPGGILDYQQIVQIKIQEYCSAHISNASDPSGRYLWCGASCADFAKLYTYPTSGQIEEYQLAKLNASNYLTTGLKALADAQKLLSRAQEALARAQAAGQDTAYAQERLDYAQQEIALALVYHGQASYAFDQNDFPAVGGSVYYIVVHAAAAGSYASQAYSSLVYTQDTYAYLNWYINSTGILIGEITQIINDLQPVIKNNPGGPLGKEIAGWAENLTIARKLVEDAQDLMRKGDTEGAKDLLQQARDILLRIRQAIEKAFDRVYTELLKAANNDYLAARGAADSLWALANKTFTVKGINDGDFKAIGAMLGKAEIHLAHAKAHITRAENTTNMDELRKAVNAGFAAVANARFQVIFATLKYKIATFKTETLIFVMTIAAAILACAVIVKDIIDTSRKKRLELVRTDIVGEPRAQEWARPGKKAPPGAGPQGKKKQARRAPPKFSPDASETVGGRSF